MINKLSIRNFKSIKELDIDCARVNLFIGEPNTGKSNILEALGLLSWCGCEGLPLSDFVRFQYTSNLFYDNLTNQISDVRITRRMTTENIEFNVDLGTTPKSENYVIYVGKSTEQEPFKSFELKEDHQINLDNEILTDILVYDFAIAGITLQGQIGISVVKLNHEWLVFDNAKIYSVKKMEGRLFAYEYALNFRALDKFGKLSDFNKYQHFLKFIKLYQYKRLDEFPDKSISTLIHPYGSNFLSLTMRNSKIRETTSSLFKNFGFNVMFREHVETLEQAKIINDVIYSHPYITVSDTLKRMIFYNAAIDSNENSTLVFEEPEVHAFPLYIKELGEKIAFDETNQYFIVTHNPYLFLSIVEKTPKDDVNVFATYMKDYQTKVKRASHEQISMLMDYDPFANLGQIIEEDDNDSD